MTETISILVIDDDELTAELVERSLRDCTFRHRIIEARDGQEGLDVLLGRSGTKITRPYLVLLDLNMPRMNGFEFLEAVRAHPRIADSVIFVVTTSDSDSDRTRAYQEQIAGFMNKASVGPQFAHLARLLHDYSTTVELPC